MFRKSKGVAWLCLPLLFTTQSCSSHFEFQQKALSQCIEIDSPDLVPVERYRWDHANSLAPDWRHVMATPAVGDLDGDRNPEIVFTAYSATAPGTYTGQGALRVIRGADGKEKFSVLDPDYSPIGATTPLLIDIDQDGKSEIVYMHYSLQRVIALNYDGQPRWTFTLPQQLRSCYGGLSGADLNGDGESEIIVENVILRENGSRDSVSATLLSGPYQGTSCTAFAMSLDPSRPNEMQIINGSGVYAPNGDRVWAFPQGVSATNKFFLAAADVRQDIEGVEVVGVDGGFMTLYNGLTGDVIWHIQTPSDPGRYNGLPGAGGPPNISDFDGDGKPDIGVANAVFYSVFDSRGQLKWSQPNHDYSSNVTGSSVFDFNGDGVAEVLYADEANLRIFNGPTGTTLATIPNPSHTLLENPVVADVDNDGHADLVVPANNAYNPLTDMGEEGRKINAIGSGIRVFKAQSETAWVKTRSVWNQYAYFVTNVTENLTATNATPTAAGQIQKIFRQNVLNQFEPQCERRR
ncbi:MAG TPA: VCBS repeat-containing protein [Bdellovibrionales bacterium]|nr:VCBS repeat-containing protein [Bdellovibrionales bacterium]